MKIKNIILVIMACFLIVISMSCICACDDADVTNTRDVDNILVHDAIDDSVNNIIGDGGSSADYCIDVVDDGGSSADYCIDVVDDGGSSATADNIDDSDSSADDSSGLIDDGASSDASSIVVDDGDSIIKNMAKDVSKYNNAPISNLKDGGVYFSDLQKLVDNLPAGSVLYLYKDYVMQDHESSVAIYKDITIDGNNHKLDADKKGTIFVVMGGNVVLSNLLLTNGKAPVNGGAINLKLAKNLVCNKVNFTDNFADDWGGAVYIESNPATFIGCRFLKNKIDDHDGGAIYTKDKLTCTNCKFENNTADAFNGGAIYAVGRLNCTNCSFSYNTAKVNGGAIFSTEIIFIDYDGKGSSTFKYNKAGTSGRGGAIYSIGIMFVINSLFKQNVAYSGGAIYSLENYMIIDNCEFTDNYLFSDFLDRSAFGGAIFCSRSIYGSSCKFSCNTANDRGGAIYVKESLNLDGDNEFIANEAGDFGGAIYSKEDVDLNWDANGHSTFKTNRAKSDSGGAIYCEKSVYVGNAVFDSNFAEDNGGAIFSKGDTNVNWDDNCKSTFKSNKANSDSGGAVYSEMNVYVANVVFDSNFAEDNGGAIFSKLITYVNWYINGESIFKFNKANTDDGGSIYSKANVYVRNSDFSYGYAHDGGAIFSEGNTIIDSSVFNVNYASHQGGAIYCKMKMTLLGRTSFAANEAGDSGGAIYTRKFDEDVYHATFRYNVAGDDGGAIYIDHENHETFTECDFEDNYAGDEGGAIYLDDGDSSLSLKRNNLVNNKAKSGYTVYNHGNYGEIKDNWHGSSNPNFDNQFKKYRLILKDKVITPDSYVKSRISW